MQLQYFKQISLHVSNTRRDYITLAEDNLAVNVDKDLVNENDMAVDAVADKNLSNENDESSTEHSDKYKADDLS